MADSGTGAEKFKMSLEHLIGPESKEDSKEKQIKIKHTVVWGHEGDMGMNWKNSQGLKLEQFYQQNKAVLDYKRKYKYLWVYAAINKLFNK